MKYTCKFCRLISVSLTLLSGGCGTSFDNHFFTNPPFPIIDSGVPALDHQMYWIDDTTVLFLGYGKLESGVNKGKYEQVLMTFDSETKSANVYRWDRVSTFCFSEGYISYAAYVEGNEKFFKGSIGVEKMYLRETLTQHSSNQNYIFNRLTCRDFDNTIFYRKNIRIKPLRDRDGYLDLGSPSHLPLRGKNQITLYRNGQSDGLKLPIIRSFANEVGYAPFNEAYYLMRGPYISGYPEYVDGRYCEPIWWMNRDGLVTKDCGPDAVFKQRSRPHYVPTKNGFVMRTLHLPSAYNSSDSGLYMMIDKKLTKLIGGIIQVGIPGRVAVSPNGCKLAFTHVKTVAAEKESFRNRRLKVIDVCDGNEK